MVEGELLFRTLPDINLGSLLLVPAYLKFGRRPIMLLSLLMVRLILARTIVLY